MRTCRPAFHRGGRRRGVQVERQANDHRFNAVVFRLGDQVAVILVDFDVPAGFRLGLPAVLGHQTAAGVENLLVAVERPPLVKGADVGNRLDFDIPGLIAPDQDAAFIAGAKDADADQVALGRHSQSRTRPMLPAADARQNATLEEVASRDRSVLLARPSLLGTDIHHGFLPSSVSGAGFESCCFRAIAGPAGRGPQSPSVRSDILRKIRLKTAAEPVIEEMVEAGPTSDGQGRQRKAATISTKFLSITSAWPTTSSAGG